MQIGPYTIKQSNASRHYQSSVKILREGCIIAQIRSDSGNLWNLCKRNYHLPERQELIRQCKIAGVSEEDMQMLLKVTAKDSSK